MAEARNTSTILRDAKETLQTAELGLADLTGGDPRRLMPGLRNVVVFGHATTQALQNLRTVMREDFDTWYEPKREAMRQDQLLKYFWDLRSTILKEGRLGNYSTTHVIENLDMRKLRPVFGNPPPGAQGWFVGDHLGGSGWDIELPDGTTEPYYIALPENTQIESTLHFDDPPTTHLGQELTDTSIATLAAHYIEYLRGLVREATDQFTHRHPQDDE